MEISGEDWRLAGTAIAVALGSGLLIGLERERSKGAGAAEGAARTAAGVRTFSITALAGALSALAGNPVLLAVTGAAVALLTAFSYRRTAKADPGLTTEMALITTFVIGVLSARHPALAGAAGILVALLLVSRGVLHTFASRQLSPQELSDGILLLAAALLVLPMLPDRPLDPWGAVNPSDVWRLTVLVMVVNAAGYVAQRAVGAHYGLPFSGLLGGFVSSTVVVASMGRRAKEDPSSAGAAVAAASLSNITMIVKLAMVLAAINRSLLYDLKWSLVASGVAMAVVGALFIHNALNAPDRDDQVKGRAFSIRTALLFAALFTALSIIAVGAERLAGEQGALAGAAVAGFLDAHATSAAVAGLVNQGVLTDRIAAIAVAVIVTTNTVSKLVLAHPGGRAYFLRLAPNLLLLVVAFWLPLLLLPSR